MKFPVLLIANPGASSYSKKKIDQAIEILASSGAEIDVFLTKKKGDAEIRAREALKERPSLIVAAGGDGTINDVVNGIAVSDIPVGILPMGSINVLSREVAISKNIKKALIKIIKGKKHNINLGRIHAISTNITRYFLLMADIGYGGSTVYDLNDRIRRFSSRSAFVISGTKNLLKSNPDKLLFHIANTHHEGYHAIISNVSRYAGNFRVTPDANLGNPELFICIFKSGKRIDLAKYLFGIAVGCHRTFKDVIYMKCKELIVEGSSHIQLDGNYFGKSPVKIDTVQNALSLIY